MLLRYLAGWLLVVAPAAAQRNTAYPLESVVVEGSAASQAVVLETAGLTVGAAIDKAGIEGACERLSKAGLFSSVQYHYAPGPKGGYALTLVVAEHERLVAATIDIPSVDEGELWQYIASVHPRFDRRVPEVDGAQQFVARLIERKLGAALRGGPIVVRLESDLDRRTILAAFQPQTLPKVEGVIYKGNQAISSQELDRVLKPVLAGQGYTGRMVARAIEENVRPLYEQAGYYRVRLQPQAPQTKDGGVTVPLEVTEGSTYSLGKVEVTGEGVSPSELLAKAKFPTGKVANWKQIQEGLWAMESLMKRAGYLEVSANPGRRLDDSRMLLDLTVEIRKGRQYRFGELHFEGLAAKPQEQIRKQWRMKSGDPYDYAYPVEFLSELGRRFDLSALRAEAATAVRSMNGEPVVDVTLKFRPK
ncbi:MAG: POTRA domain-containing protein [Bryobacteraceae bacterium]|nr:POTRA domain-containing protein [Bryobacteraceae bacterium]